MRLTREQRGALEQVTKICAGGWAATVARAVLQLDDTQLDKAFHCAWDIQIALDRAGYDPGPHDGVWGPLTENAFNRFKLDVLGRDR